MQNTEALSPHRLVEFLTAISRCQDRQAAMQTAAELVAEDFDAEVGVVIVGDELRAAVGFGQREVPAATLLSVAPGAAIIDLAGLYVCHTLTAVWDAGSHGRLLVARAEPAFTSDARNLLLGMAGALGMVLDMLRVLERERGRHRVLEVLLDIQRAISHRAPLSTILAAVTDGASVVMQGCLVSLLLDDALDPDRPIIAGADLTGAVATTSVPVHIHGEPAGALVASTRDGSPIGDADRALLRTFAEHASLALTDAQTVEAMQEAFRDSLTGLPNRALFLDRLSQALLQREPRRSALAVLFIDLDRFKAVNDSLGHAAGDVLLRAVAERIRACTRSHDTAARFGGDEFALLLQDDDDPSCAPDVAERIIAALREPFTIEGKVVFIGATIGIAYADRDNPEASADDLLSNADLAMYRAKARGSGQALTYHPAMRVALMERLDMQARLQFALGSDQLAVHYQPIVELDTGLAIGLEALIRWNHPHRGMVSPAEFVPVAESTGAIVPLGRWVLNEACQQLARWRLTSPDLRMNINVSVRQLRDRGFPADLERILADADLSGSALTLEITESAMIEDEHLTYRTLYKLKEFGVSIALDDFGTGYSPLGYLQKFPVDILKIERSFVSGPASASGGDKLVRTIIELGRAFDLDVIAEGIEDEMQRLRLRRLGCRIGQGYHFARPASAAEIWHYIREHADPI